MFYNSSVSVFYCFEFWNDGRSLCVSLCSVRFCSDPRSDPVLQTHTGGYVAASALLVSVAGRSMNRLWHKMAAVGSMCMEAAQVQLASVCRYQRRQAEELLSPGPTGWTSHSRSYFPLLSLETLSLSLSPPPCLSISLSLPHFPSSSSSSVSIPALRGICCSPTGLFVPLLRWHPSCQEGEFRCSTSPPSPPPVELITRSCVPTHIKDRVTARVLGTERRECVSCKSWDGMIERAVSVRPVQIQRVNRKPERRSLRAQHHGLLPRG